MKIIAIRLRYIRNRLKMSIESFAKLLNVNPSTYKSWERNKKIISSENLKYISEKLCVSVEFLIGHSDDITIKNIKKADGIYTFDLKDREKYY